MIEMEPDSIEVEEVDEVDCYQGKAGEEREVIFGISINCSESSTSQFFNNIGWDDVQEDLIYLLLSKIGCLTSYIRFSSVCRFWHSIASANKLCKHIVAPWLLLSEKEDSDIREFYDISRNEVYQFPLIEAKGKKILGSAHGWLIMVDADGQFNLFNPVNRTHVSLPPYTSFQSVIARPPMLTPQEIRDLFTSRATLVPDPSTGDFVIMVVHMGYDEFALSFCRSSNQEWTKFDAYGVDRMLDFACGHFFNMNVGGEIFTCEVAPTPKMELVASLDLYDTTGSYYVAECDGEIFLISRFRWINDEIPFDM